VSPDVEELIGGDEAAHDSGEVSADSLSTSDQRALTLDESVLVARLLFHAGRVSEADRLLRPLVRVFQDRADLLKLWARIKHTQGQLTEALRAYERVNALAPMEPSALINLEMISRIAQLPDANKRELELDLVKDEALARVHRAQLELERAFRLAANNKFTSAVEICDRLAEQHKTGDPALYKLALLEKAIFLETIGQFDGAIQTLERLGNTRGFEVDKDRLKSLARTYERRGSSEDLARAMKVYAFLFDQTAAPEMLSRIARIAERKGDRAEMEQLERRFIQAFSAEQQELTLDELLEASSLHHVPLATLRWMIPDREEIATRRASLEAALSKTRANGSAGSKKSYDIERRLALLEALAQDYEKSAEHWRQLIVDGASHPADTKYFADMREELSDPAGAHALYLAALSSEHVADAEILGRMLSIDDAHLERVLGAIFADEGKRGRTYEALKQSAKSHQLSPEVWHTLARFEGLIGRQVESARHQAKAEALLRVQGKGGPRIGHVQVAAVYEFQGRKQGMVHEIWASRYRVRPGEGGQLDEGSIFGNVARDMMRDIQNVFVAVCTFVQQKFPHLVEDLGQYRYVLKVTKDDEISGGNSAGIAVALAFVSVFLQKPVPQDFAITGSLVADSSSEIRLHRVADVDYKMLGVYQRRLQRLIVPAENRVDLEASHVIPRKIWEGRVSFAKNLTQVMKLAFGADLWEW
jgi:tetratricopeptide (TPR) repeat protein